MRITGVINRTAHGLSEHAFAQMCERAAPILRVHSAQFICVFRSFAPEEYRPIGRVMAAERRGDELRLEVEVDGTAEIPNEIALKPAFSIRQAVAVDGRREVREIGELFAVALSA
jgi:hypothetical protein